MPEGYFDKDTVDVLTAVRDRALSDRREELLAEFPTALAACKVRNTWRSAAVCVYRNWLLYLCAQKDRHLKARQGRRECKRVSVATLGLHQNIRAQQRPEASGDTAREEEDQPVGRSA
jgi:hypothetical protein